MRPAPAPATALTAALLCALSLPVMAEVEPQCRITSTDNAPVTAVKKPGSAKTLALIPSGTLVASAEVRKRGQTNWLRIYPVSQLSQNDGWVKASEVTCEGKIATLWGFDETEYADADPEFYCSWPVNPGETGVLINEFAVSNRAQYGSNPKDDTFKVAGHPLPIRFWVDARAEVDGETWLRAMYFDDENTVGWVAESQVICE